MISWCLSKIYIRGSKIIIMTGELIDDCDFDQVHLNINSICVHGRGKFMLCEL